MNIDRQPGSCAQRHCLHCVFIRCVGGIPRCTVIVGLLLHEDGGECSEGGGGGGVTFLSFFPGGECLIS